MRGWLGLSTGLVVMLVSAAALAGSGSGNPPAGGGGGSGPEPELFALALFSLLPGVYFARKALVPGSVPPTCGDSRRDDSAD